MQWRLASAVTVAAAQFGVGVLLARLLPPAEFGLVAMALVVLGLIRLLGDFGIGERDRPASNPDRTPHPCRIHVSTVFACATAAIVAIVAPAAAAVLREPRVAPVLQALALGVAVGGTGSVAGAMIRRRLDFRRQFFIDLGSYLVGYAGLAAALAVGGFGVWSLVGGTLIQSALASIAQLFVGRHAVRPLLAVRELADLLHFGVGATASNCANYVALTGDNFIVGRAMGATALGLYQRAYMLMALPFTHAASILSSALLPAFSQVQEDPVRLRRGYLLASGLTGMVAAPAMATLAIVAPHLVVSLYGPHWSGVVRPLQVLCLAGFFRAVPPERSRRAFRRSCVRRSLATGRIRHAGACRRLTGILVWSDGDRCGRGCGDPLYVCRQQPARAAIDRDKLVAVLAVQRRPIRTAVLAGAIALPVRIVCEALELPSAWITLAVLTCCRGAVGGWLLTMLGNSEFRRSKANCPRGRSVLSTAVSGSSCASRPRDSRRRIQIRGSQPFTC